LLSRNPETNKPTQKQLAKYVYPHLVLLFETYFSSVSGAYSDNRIFIPTFKKQQVACNPNTLRYFSQVYIFLPPNRQYKYANILYIDYPYFLNIKVDFSYINIE
jgi:hypothetical protein